MSSKTEVEKPKDRIRAEAVYNVTASGFPIEQWREWDKDCRERYGDCRWIKMWSDHVRAKDLDRIEKFEQRIVELEALVHSKDKKEEEVGVAKTFGGTIKSGGK